MSKDTIAKHILDSYLAGDRVEMVRLIAKAFYESVPGTVADWVRFGETDPNLKKLREDLKTRRGAARLIAEAYQECVAKGDKIPPPTRYIELLDLAASSMHAALQTIRKANKTVRASS